LRRRREPKGYEEDVVKMYMEGLPIKEIKRRLGLSSTEAIYRIVRERGILRRRKSSHKKLSPEVEEEIRRRYREGESIYRLAKEYGLSTSRVYYIVKVKS